MTARPLATALLLPLLLGACGTLQRLSDAGRPPAMTPTSDPTRAPSWQPVSLPMPNGEILPHVTDSLWRPGSRAFFKDQRAARVGDLITILVNTTDAAALINQTTATRAANDQTAVPNFFGFEALLPKLVTKALTPSNLLTTYSTDSLIGNGTLTRSEAVTLRVAGVVTQVLPNGNLVVAARQEMRVNSELRNLEVTGIIRPEDIASDNTIPHDRMAEARISYGGRGTLTNDQTSRYGQQVMDALMPF